MEAPKLINYTGFSFSRTFQVLENQGKKLQDFSVGVGTLGVNVAHFVILSNSKP